MKMYWKVILDAFSDCRKELREYAKRSYKESKKYLQNFEYEDSEYYRGLADGYRMSASHLRDLIDAFRVR